MLSLYHQRHLKKLQVIFASVKDHSLLSCFSLNHTPTWVHFDKRQGPPACRAGYPTLHMGSRGVYVLVLQDALNALGYNTYTLDGAFGNNTRNALISFQRNNNLRADGIAGCNTWTRLVDEAVGIGRTPTVIDP